MFQFSLSNHKFKCRLFLVSATHKKKIRRQTIWSLLWSACLLSKLFLITIQLLSIAICRTTSMNQRAKTKTKMYSYARTGSKQKWAIVYNRRLGLCGNPENQIQSCLMSKFYFIFHFSFRLSMYCIFHIFFFCFVVVSTEIKLLSFVLIFYTQNDSFRFYWCMGKFSDYGWKRKKIY